MRHDALALQLVERGLVTAHKVVRGRMSAPPRPVARVATAAMIPAILAAGGPSARATDRPQGFAPGDGVRARLMNPAHHTRLPRYLRGHVGEVVACHGAHVFPDSNATRQGEDPHPLYTVRFPAAALWGTAARDVIHADLWEPYLEPF